MSAVAFARADERQSTSERVIVTFGLMCATLMMTIDQTIANVALPHLQGSLSASQDQITWVLTSYIVATAIMTPLSGWLALKIGRRPMFLFCIAGFVAASILCGMATSLPEIVVFRILQGFAGAGMQPLSQAAMVDMWPGPMLPRVMSIWASVTVVGPIAGPTLGGWLTENYSWRWVFYINLPIGALAFIMVFLFMRGGDGGRARPFDFLGFAALVLFTSSLQLMLDRGPGQDWFDSREIWFEAVLAACGFYVFIAQSLTAEHPFFHRDLMQDRNYVSSLIFGFCVTFALFSIAALMPTLMQTLLGYSAFQSGQVTMASGLGSLTAFALVPWMTRRLGYRPTIAIGITLVFVALWRMAHFDLSMTANQIRVASVIQGFGIGMVFNPIAVLSYTTLPGHLRTEAAVLANVVRTMGGSIGIATLTALLIRQSATAHERLAANIVPSDPVVRAALPPSFDSTVGGLASVNAEVTRQGMMMGYDAVFAWLCLGIAMLMPLLLLIRPTKSASSQLSDGAGH
jgi:DHA2 family multidrug resistance protein